MKKTKILCLLCAFCLSIASFSACGFGKVQGKKGLLQIAAFEGGYGNTWAQALADAYKRHNPDVQINVTCNPFVRDWAGTAISSGLADKDIYFTDGISIGSACENYESVVDISELYKMKPKAGDKEEELTIEEKIRPEILEDMKYGGDNEKYQNKYYAVPSSSGPCSLILNVTALNASLGEGNWREPRTTDEFFELCDAIVAANKSVSVQGVSHRIYPFIFSGLKGIDYVRYLYNHWIIQYSGKEAWDGISTFKINGEYKKEAFQPEGKKIAWKIMEKVFKRDGSAANSPYLYADPESSGLEFNVAQKYFIQGRACMFVTGDWLEREMEGTTEASSEMRMIRTPMVSDLSEKLEADYGVSLGSTHEQKDAKLREMVTAADAGESGVDGVSDEVFAYVNKARKYVFSIGNQMVGFVPSATLNYDLAIDFLRFMYSDEGIQIVLNESKSYLPVRNPQNYTLANGSNFIKSTHKFLIDGSEMFFMSAKDPIRYRTGMDWHLGAEKPEISLSKRNAMTAEECLAREMDLLNRSWNSYMNQVS